MSLERARRQKPEQLGLPLDARGGTPVGQRSGEALTAADGNERSGTDRLMEEVVERSNAKAALKRVRQNKGSPGTDGMTVGELPPYLAEEWERIRAELLAGTYHPQPVKRQEIPKPGGGIRELGIPCAVDRFIQQAILQVLQPRFDPTFSDHSYGFRPGRRAHDAVCAAQNYIQEGRRWVVDVDLEKFFDRVNHDVLMSRLAARIADQRLLGLIRRYLGAGVMAHGVVAARHEGTPQGGPLSPLLANLLLDEVDRELEKRGHAFVRYADDCNVYMRSQRAGERVMQALRCLYAGLRLRVNEAKSAVARPEDRKFLGYSFQFDKEGVVRRRVAPKALETMRARVRELTARRRGRNLVEVMGELSRYLRGWKTYFRLAEHPTPFASLDSWIRRRLRMVQLSQWKTGSTAYRKLRALGIPARVGYPITGLNRRWWCMAASPALHMAFPTRYYDRMGLPRLAT